MFKTITVSQKYDIDIDDFVKYLFSCIEDRFIEFYDIDDPQNLIDDYDEVTIAILKAGIKQLTNPLSED